jgi:hypothetical protein
MIEKGEKMGREKLSHGDSIIEYCLKPVKQNFSFSCLSGHSFATFNLFILLQTIHFLLVFFDVKEINL